MRGQQLTHYHSDLAIGTTRLILEYDHRALLVRQPAADGGKWTLPGGRARQIDVITDWDMGNVIACLEGLIAAQLGVTVEWMTYVADFREGEVCRVYAHPLDENPTINLQPGTEARWVGIGDLGDIDLADNMREGFEADALRAWWRDGHRRGVGQSQQRAGLVKRT